MKKIITTVALLAGAVSVYSQGVINYSDYAAGVQGFNIHIWSPQLATPSVENYGNSTTLFQANQNSAAQLQGDNPVGSVNPGYTGVLIGGAGTGKSSSYTPANMYQNGDNFTVELYAGAGTLASFSSLVPLPGTLSPIADGPYNENTSSVPYGAGVGYAGQYVVPGAGTVTFNGSAGAGGLSIASGAVTVALAAWFNGGGQWNTLAAAEAAGVPFGWSKLGTENVASGTGNVPYLPGPGMPQTLSGGITSFSLTTVPEPSTIALGIIGASAFLMRLRRKQ